MRRAALLALALAATGCPTSVTTPIKPPVDPAVGGDLPNDRGELLEIADASVTMGPSGPDIDRARRAAEKIVAGDAEDGEALWRVARAIYYQTMTAPKEGLPAMAARCMQFGALAVKHSQRAEAHFYYALCMGARAQAVNLEGLGLIGNMVKAAEAAVAADPKAIHGGPHRLLGGIYLHAPAWPTSCGDSETAVEHLQKAVALDPTWPENHLILAEALLAEDREDEARAALSKARANMSNPAAAGWVARFEKSADELEAKLAQ